MEHQEASERLPIYLSAIIRLLLKCLGKVSIGWNDLLRCPRSKLVELVGIKIKKDGSDKIVCEAETDRHSQRDIGAGETDQVATAEQRNPLVEQSDDEIQHSTADLITSLAPMEKAVMESNPKLGLLHGEKSNLCLDIPS